VDEEQDIVSALTYNAHRIYYDRDYARDVGFTDKLCIYPGQVALAIHYLSPSTTELEWPAAFPPWNREMAPAHWTGR
jgi:citrate lyase beta subunit